MVHLIHARASHHGRLGLYLRSVHFRSGVEEVDVLIAVVEEVVVHVRLGEVLDESNIFGATVVVHGRHGK